MADIATETKEINVPKSGRLNVIVQGKRSENEVVILTVHDLGCNANTYQDFLAHPVVDPLAQRCVWVHVTLPGQGDHEADLPSDYHFPTIQDIADDLIHVCDQLEVKQLVVFGEGAGANILARFAMAHDERVMGAVLIHLTGSTAGFMESMRDRIIGWKLNTLGMNPTAESYLVLHRFGTFKDAKTEQDLKNMVANFKESLRTTINAKNLNRYITAFMGRTHISDKIGTLKCPVLFMTGGVAAHYKSVQGIYSLMQKTFKDEPNKRTKVELVVVDGVANVLSERPEKVSDCLQYFLQGLGLISGLVNRRMSNTVPPFRQRSMSMEEYDKPKGVENYFEGGMAGSPPRAVIPE